MKIQPTPTLIALAAASALGIAVAPAPDAPDFTIPNEFVAGTPARASEVNENFDALSTSLDSYATEVNDAIAAVEATTTSLSTTVGALETQVESVTRDSNWILVAANGGDFTSVAEALASITDAADDNRYLVQVAPGVYTETDVCTVPSFVELRGSGRTATVVTSTRSSVAQNDASSTMRMEDQSRVSGLSIHNEGNSSTYAIGVIGSDLTSDTVIENVDIRVDGAGGTGHFGIYISDSDLRVLSSLIYAAGADSGAALNVALGSVDFGGAFAQPLLRDSQLEGDGTVTGYGMYLSSTAATVDDCIVQGDQSAIAATVNGITTVLDSKIQTLGLNPVYEQSGSATILSGNTFFVGGDPSGLASQFKYAHCIKPNFDIVVDGTGSDI